LALCAIRSGGLTLHHLANLGDSRKRNNSIDLIVFDYGDSNADQVNLRSSGYL
jgi:hypothetical protein